MPEDQTPSPEEQLRGRYSVPLPVIRPIPARALVAGVSAIFFALSLFGFFAEYGRKELVPASISPVGGEARVSSTDAAVVKAVTVRLGQAVQAGAPLLEVSTDQASVGGSVATAARNALNKRADAIRGELALVDQDIAIRRAGLESQVGVVTGALKQAQAEVGFREEVVRRLKADLERRTPLASKGAVSDAALEELRLQLASAQANVLSSSRELATLRWQLSQLTSELSALTLRAPLTRAEKEKELASIEEELARAAVVAERQILSPIDGVVSAVPVSEGQSLTPGALVAVVSPKDAPAEVVLLIPSSSVAAVRAGLEVNLRLDAYPFESYGYVGAVIRSVDGTPTAATKEGAPLVRAHAQVVRVPPRIELRPGMSGVAAVEVERRTLLAWVLWPLLKNFLG